MISLRLAGECGGKQRKRAPLVWGEEARSMLFDWA
ncbi:hypothetical protein PYK22_00147 [Pyrinomonas methylaliphatogenes]|jgi:hypothetical protein|uniref:Uncharacterized protein n=1 Tax=Pyrinomonas methylaliphatogenes TaxID=454194 RepID=A0A0B6WVK8_9BACT|nr:hypothetical protein PYK22_00147 [Pyrinomonas methylaliphatogenes]